MSMDQWMERLEALRQNCERIDLIVKNAGHVVDKILRNFHIGPPATIGEVEEAEKKLGFAFPSSLRKVLLEFSGSFDVFWYLYDTPIAGYPVGCTTLSRGSCSWSIDEIISASKDFKEAIPYYIGEENDEMTEDDRLDREWYIDYFRDRTFWLNIPNGDELMIGCRNEDQQEISYFMHDGSRYDGSCSRLGKDFEDFIDRWMQLAFIGPEYWVIEDFIADGELKPDSELGRQFQDWFFGDHCCRDEKM